MSANPFKPTAGKMPPILIGRQPIVEDFIEGIDNGAGAPGRLMLLTGQRGYGKTVLLTELRREAQARGWACFAETASDGLVTRLVEEISPRGMGVAGLNISPSVGLSGVANMSLGTLAVSNHSAPLTLRRAIEERMDGHRLSKGKGILITVDEAQAASRDDLVAIATAVQHAIVAQDLIDVPDDEKKGIALVFAGVPSVADDLLNDKVMTFLRRAMRRELGAIPLCDIRDAYVQTVRASGKSIDLENAERAAVLTDGYPYMVQLIGYYMWQSAQRDGRTGIRAGDIDSALRDSLEIFGDAVCAPAYNGLSTAARELARDIAAFGPGPVKMADLELKAGKSRSWLNKYRAVLVASKFAVVPERGSIELSIPHMAEYLAGR